MACGVHLGILLVCLVQAEHVRCLWATEDQSSQRHNSDRYVGFSQHDSGVQRLGGSYPQNQFRQASVSTGSAHNRSFNTQTVDNSGFSQGLSTSGSTQTVPQSAPDDYASVGLLQSSSGSKPNRRLTNWQRVNVQKVPKAQFLNLYTPISSGRSINDYNKNQNGRFNGEKRTWPVQQDTPHPSKYLFGKTVSVQKPSVSQSTAQRPYDSAAKTPVNAQRDLSSRLFSADPSTETQPFACGLGRRVFSHRHSASFKPSRFPPPQNESPRKNPSQRKPYQSQLFPVSGGNTQGSYEPSSNVALSCASFSQHPPDSPYRRNAVVSYELYGLEIPTNQGRLSSASTSMSFGQASWKNRNPAQGAHNLPASDSSRVESSAQRFAPTKTYIIPQHFGGSAIRRLKEPADQKEVSVLKPQQTYTVSPQQPASYKPQAHKVRWFRVRPLH